MFPALWCGARVAGGSAKKPTPVVIPEAPGTPYNKMRVLSSVGLYDRSAPPVFEPNRFEARARAACERCLTPKKSTSDLRRGFGFNDRPLPQAVEEEPHIRTASGSILVASRYRSTTPGHEGTPQRHRDAATPKPEATTASAKSPQPAPEAKSTLRKMAETFIGKSPHRAERDVTQSTARAPPNQDPAAVDVTLMADASDDDIGVEERVLRTVRFFNQEHKNAGAFITRGLSDEQVDTLEKLLAQRRRIQLQQQRQQQAVKMTTATSCVATRNTSNTQPPPTVTTRREPAVNPAEATSAIERFLELQASMASKSTSAGRYAAAAAVPAPPAAAPAQQPHGAAAAFPAAQASIQWVATPPTQRNVFASVRSTGQPPIPVHLTAPPMQKWPSAEATPAPPLAMPQPGTRVRAMSPPPLRAHEAGEHPPARPLPPPPPVLHAMEEVPKVLATAPAHAHEQRQVHRERRFMGLLCIGAAAARHGVAEKKRMRPAHTARAPQARAAAPNGTVEWANRLVEEACRRYAEECRREEAAIRESICRERAQAAAAAPLTRPTFPVARASRSPSLPGDVNRPQSAARKQRRYSFISRIVDDGEDQGSGSTSSSVTELNGPLYDYRCVVSHDGPVQAVSADPSPSGPNGLAHLKRVNEFRRDLVAPTVSPAASNAVADTSISSFFAQGDYPSSLMTATEAMKSLGMSFVNEPTLNTAASVDVADGGADPARQSYSFALGYDSPSSRPPVMQPRDTRLRVGGNVFSSSNSSTLGMWVGASQASVDDDPVVELAEYGSFVLWHGDAAPRTEEHLPETSSAFAGGPFRMDD